jgi:hypothetical protein
MSGRVTALLVDVTSAALFRGAAAGTLQDCLKASRVAGATDMSSAGELSMALLMGINLRPGRNDRSGSISPAATSR